MICMSFKHKLHIPSLSTPKNLLPIEGRYLFILGIFWILLHKFFLHFQKDSKLNQLKLADRVEVERSLEMESVSLSLNSNSSSLRSPKFTNLECVSFYHTNISGHVHFTWQLSSFVVMLNESKLISQNRKLALFLNQI